MRIREVIKQLQEIEESHGDVGVVINRCNFGEFGVDTELAGDEIFAVIG